MLLFLMEVSVNVTEGTELPPCDLFRWKYQCKWLIGPHSYSLQPQSHYHHATYYSESIWESGLSVHNSHRLKAQSYLHATYLSQSICKSGLSVHDSHRLQHRATYSGGSTCESGLQVLDSHRLKTQSYLHATYPGGSIHECGLSIYDRLQRQNHYRVT